MEPTDPPSKRMTVVSNEAESVDQISLELDTNDTTDRIEVQEKPVDIGPEAMDLEGIDNSVSCEHPTEGQLEYETSRMSRHNKLKKVNTPVIPQDYICTNEDISIIQDIMSVPPKTKLVGIGDAVLAVEDLAGLINGGVFLDDSVINAYIYCMRAQEHLRRRTGGNVHLETTYVSAILKRDGKLDIAPSDHGYIIRRLHNYLQHDMIYIPVNIKNYHWYLAVVNAKMCEIQVLDSFGPDVQARDDLTLILQGLKKHLDIASKSTDFIMGNKWQNLDVASWPIKEYSHKRVQEDGTSCGLFLTNYMEYWTGDELSDNVTQEDMKQFRQKLAVILYDSELNRLKGSPEFAEAVHTTYASEDINEHNPTKHNMESESSNDLMKDKSPPCILPSRIMPENSRDLVGELCTFIMSIDDVKCLEEQWVVSSKPYPISISLKEIQDILKTDQAMDCKSFNKAVCILACDELMMLKDTPDHFMDLKFCSMVSEYARDPKVRTAPDIQSLAKLLHSCSSCRWDGDQLRKRILVHLLSYIDNEAAHIIPDVARELISHIIKKNTKIMVYFLSICM